MSSWLSFVNPRNPNGIPLSSAGRSSGTEANFAENSEDILVDRNGTWCQNVGEEMYALPKGQAWWRREATNKSNVHSQPALGAPSVRHSRSLASQFARESLPVNSSGWTYEIPFRNSHSWPDWQILLVFGSPESILTDQGTNFLSEVFKNTCKFWKIKKLRTTAYHPQTNGGLERSHDVLKDYLRMFVNHDQNSWDEWVGPAVFTYTLRKMRQPNILRLNCYLVGIYGFRENWLESQRWYTTIPITWRISRTSFKMHTRSPTKFDRRQNRL